MAKVKNTGGQPRGFNTEDGGHIVLRPGEEKEFNMTEADHKHLTKMLEDHDDPKPFEISGSHGGVKAAKKETKEGDVEMPAQSVEPPPSSTGDTPAAAPVTVTPQTEKEKRERAEASKKEDAPHRGR